MPIMRVMMWDGVNGSYASIRVSWWRHQMEIVSALLAICAGNSPVTGEFRSQRPVTRSLDVFLDLCLNNCRVHNRDAGDLRRHRAHYDVTVMETDSCHTVNCQEVTIGSGNDPITWITVDWTRFNSLALGGFEWKFRYVIFKTDFWELVEAFLVKLP